VLLLLLLSRRNRRLFPPPAEAGSVAARHQKNPAQDPQTFKAEFVEIPGGSFEMDEVTVRHRRRPLIPSSPNVPTDKTEVTNAEYGQFVRENKYGRAYTLGWPQTSRWLELWQWWNVSSRMEHLANGVQRETECRIGCDGRGMGIRARNVTRMSSISGQRMERPNSRTQR